MGKETLHEDFDAVGTANSQAVEGEGSALVCKCRLRISAGFVDQRDFDVAKFGAIVTRCHCPPDTRGIYLGMSIDSADEGRGKRNEQEYFWKDRTLDHGCVSREASAI